MIVSTLRSFLWLIIIAFSSLMNAQEIQQVVAKGLIIDKESGLTIPYARLASYRQMEIFTTDIGGEFNLKLFSDDSLRIVVLGYEPVVLKVSQFLNRGGMLYKVLLDKASIPLKEVVIRQETANNHLAEIMPSDIKMGYVSDVHPTLRSDVGGKPPVLAAFTNPISFAYYHLGTKEKRKRHMKQTLQDEVRLGKYSKELVAEITGFKGQELDDFFVYCNANIQMTSKDSVPLIRIKIINAFEKYSKSKKGK